MNWEVVPDEEESRWLIDGKPTTEAQMAEFVRTALNDVLRPSTSLFFMERVVDATTRIVRPALMGQDVMLPSGSIVRPTA